MIGYVRVTTEDQCPLPYLSDIAGLYRGLFTLHPILRHIASMGRMATILIQRAAAARPHDPRLPSKAGLRHHAHKWQWRGF